MTQFAKILDISRETVREIFKHCDRQTSCALRTSCHELYDDLDLMEFELYEPFTYEDWEGLTRKDWQNRENSRKTWNYRYSKGDRYNRPGARRWQTFKNRINPNNGHWVRRIAMAHWMTIEDFVWIAKELPRLEALDLSDISDNYSAQDGHNVDDKAKIFRWRQVVNDIAKTGEVRVILTKGDVNYFTCLDSNEKTHYGNKIFELGQRTRQTPGNDLEKLELYNICEQLLDRERVARKKAEELEINKLAKRMGEARKANKPLTASDEVEEGQDPKKLERLKKLKSLLNRRPAQNLLKRLKWLGVRNWTDSRYHLIERYTSAGTHTSRRLPGGGNVAETFVRACSQLETLSIRGNYEPDYCHSTQEQVHDHIRKLVDDITNNVSETVTKLELRQSIEWVNFLLNELEEKTQIRMLGLDLGAWIQIYPLKKYSQASLDQSRTLDGPTWVRLDDSAGCERAHEHQNTVHSIVSNRAMTLAESLHRLHLAFNGKDRTIRPVSLIPQRTSTDTLSPLTLIERRLGPYPNVLAGFDHAIHLPEIFNWLNATFEWRPIFDWDELMLPDSPNAPSGNELAQILEHFYWLRAAHIKLHLLIGNRATQASSLYWGTYPYDATWWADWLSAEFNANLKDIAPIVDHLTLSYELRHPIPEEWITLMQKLDTISRPRNLGLSPLTQKMANKFPHKNTSSNPRAMPLRRNGTAPTLPSSDSDALEHPSATNPSLVQLARRAALAREAVGWQRFWATYALRLSALTLLRVRMPKAFDRVWSYRLARLLDQELGWRVVYSDEERRPHADGAGIVHVKRDGLFLRSRRVESPTPPSGGMFVRRTWFWGWRERADKRVGARVLSERGDRVFVLDEWESTDEVEGSELEKAIERANAATMRERAASYRLTATGGAGPSDGGGPSGGGGPSSGGGGGPPYRYYRSSTPSIPDDASSVHSSPEANPNDYQGSHRQGLSGLLPPLSDLPSSSDEPDRDWLIPGGVDDHANDMPRPPPLDTHSDHPNPLPPLHSLLSHQPSRGDEPGDWNWPGAGAAGPSNQGVAEPASAGPVYNGGGDQGLFGDDGLFNNVPDAEQPERAPADGDQPTADAPRVPPPASRSAHAAEVSEAQRRVDEARQMREERRAEEALRVRAVVEQRARIGREYQEMTERERSEKGAEEKRRKDKQEAQARGAGGEAQRPDDDAPGDAEESEEEEA